MAEHMHHVHLFTHDLDATVAWWVDMLDGVVAFDGDFGGSRNVFMHVGDGRIHFYDQRPRDEGKGAAVATSGVTVTCAVPDFPLATADTVVCPTLTPIT